MFFTLFLNKIIQMMVKLNRSTLSKWQKKIGMGLNNVQYLFWKAQTFICAIIDMCFLRSKVYSQ